MVLSFALSGSVQAESKLVRLGSTTSVRASGLLDAIQPAFEHDTGYQLKASVAGSGKAMQLAREGEFDVLIVHAPAAEQELIDQGFADKRQPFMRNYFLIVGPAADPARIKGLTDVREALRRIATAKALFISRGDDSGTHQKELALWKEVAIDPIGSWYFESGLAMGAALNMANEKQAYLLIDDGTWLAKGKTTSLQTLVKDPDRLGNTYSLVTLSKNTLPQLNHAGAAVFAKWLLSDKGRSIIRGMTRDGEPLFSLTSP
jgi:tungstate transport system substrate-binding protein